MNNLESLLEIAKNKAKKVLTKSNAVNYLAGLSYFTPIMLVYETQALEKTLAESAQIRLDAAGLGVVVYPVQFKWREMWYKATKTYPNSNPIKKRAVDMLSQYTSDAILYSLLLMKNGEEPLDALKKGALGSVVTGITGTGYGWYQDRVRAIAGLEPINKRKEQGDAES